MQMDREKKGSSGKREVQKKKKSGVVAKVQANKKRSGVMLAFKKNLVGPRCNGGGCKPKIAEYAYVDSSLSRKWGGA
jgi:hypothetical protein